MGEPQGEPSSWFRESVLKVLEVRQQGDGKDEDNAEVSHGQKQLYKYGKTSQMCWRTAVTPVACKAEAGTRP